MTVFGVGVPKDNLIHPATAATTRSLDPSIPGFLSTKYDAATGTRLCTYLCSATKQLPQTTILSDGLLKTCGDIAAASRDFTSDTWRGSYHTEGVALKAFRTYPIQDLKVAEKVRHAIWVNVGFVVFTTVIDPLEGGSRIVETVS